MSITFQDQVAIVTGAGGGLGRQHALAFAARGAKVVVNDLGGAVDGSGGSSAAADAVVAEIIAAGGQAISNGASVTDRDGVQNMVKQTMDEWGRIDILVNNAGVLRDKSYAKMTMDDFEFVLDVHLTGAALCTHAVWPVMQAQAYGRIVMTTSTSGVYGNFGQSNYGAGKMGQLGIMNCLRIEGPKYGIHVNALGPVAATRMTEDVLPPQLQEILKPELVSPAVLYMACKEAPNGVIIMAGAGHFSMTRYQESEGVVLGPDATVDDVAANIDKIGDFGTSNYFRAGSEQTAHVFNMVTKAAGG